MCVERVALYVAGYLAAPELYVGAGMPRVAVVAVPETAVYHYHRVELRQHDVGSAGQIAAVEPVAVAVTPQVAAHYKLRTSVARAYSAHASMSLFGGHN